MSTIVQGLFFVLGALTIGSALMVVSVRDASRATSWMASTFAFAAALFCLLQAPFVGIVQALVGVVVVAMLFGFALRLTNNDQTFVVRGLVRRWWFAALGALVLFGLVLVPVLFRPGLPGGGSWPRNDLGAASPAETGAGVGGSVAGIAEIGRSLMQEFVLPFEVMAVLLLVGIVGAVVVVRNEHVGDVVGATTRRRIARIYTIE